MSEGNQILVIDDDPVFNRVLTRALKSRGFDVTGTHSAEEAAKLIPATRAGRAVLDLNIAGTSGLTLVAPLLAANPDCRIVVLTGYASIATAAPQINPANPQRATALRVRSQAACARVDSAKALPGARVSDRDRCQPRQFGVMARRPG